MVTKDQARDIADRIAFDLIPANGRDAWDASTLTEGICPAAELDGTAYRDITRVLERDHLYPANPVNSLYFRVLSGNGAVTDPEVARRFLPRPGRPAAGLRIQGELDDPFALLAAKNAALRAAAALPRASRKLQDRIGRAGQGQRGAISGEAAGEISRAAWAKAADAARPELRQPVQQAMQALLPFGDPPD